MLQRLKVHRLLTGFRGSAAGRPRTDCRNGGARLEFIADHADTVAEIDVNR